MSSTEPTPEFTTPNSQDESSTLLDNLIAVLIHPTLDSADWLEAIGKPVANEERVSATIGKLIRLGAYAGIEQSLAPKIIAAIIEKNHLGWTPEKISQYVEVVYKDYRKRVEFDRRIKAGLPPLD
jgi:hypothetical protein